MRLVTDDFQVSMVVADADGYPFFPDVNSFGRRFVYTPGFVYSPEICGLGKGRYEVNFSDSRSICLPRRKTCLTLRVSEMFFACCCLTDVMPTKFR